MATSTAAPDDGWRHDELGHEGGRAAARPARCRQPRPHPRAGRTREQPQGHQRRHPEAPAHGVHRGVRIGQVVAGLRHDRGRIASGSSTRPTRAFLQGFMPTPGPPRRRRARAASRRRSSSTRSGWARTPAPPSAPPPTPTRCCASCSAAWASRTSARRRRSRSTSPPSPAPAATVDTSASGDRKIDREHFTLTRRDVSALRGHGPRVRHRPRRSSSTRPSPSTRAPSRFPATPPKAGTWRSSPSPASSTPTSRSGLHRRRSCDDFLYKEATKVKVAGINMTYEGLVPRCRRSSSPRTSRRCSRTSARSSSGR